jgi:fatty acid desaturase
VASLRAIAEHQQYDDLSAAHGFAALRNFRCNALSRVLMGAYGFGEHQTHHTIPGVPYYRLKALTTELAERDPALAPRKDYFTVLAEIIRADHVARRVRRNIKP